MLQVPNHVLKKLRCAKCDGYLSCAPIVINNNSEQLCGRCFKILPEQEKTENVRQIGLEAVAELLIFPCKYKELGCMYTHPWNGGYQHDSTCPYRKQTQSLQKLANWENEFTHQSEEIEVNVYCDTFPLQSDKLKLNLDIAAKGENDLYLTNNMQAADKIRLNVDMMLSLDAMPQVHYCHAFVVRKEEEHIYDSVLYTNINSCVTCRKNIQKNEVYRCSFGHNFCKNCNKSLCTVCGTSALSKSHQYCKNYTKGCTDLFPTTEINIHEIDCEFNDFKCLLCDFTNILNDVVRHFVQTHNVISDNNLTLKLSNKDMKWYFYCYNKLFVCTYYNFGDMIEFIVMYFGSNDKARSHKYEVTLINGSSKHKKAAYCSGWNEVLLEKSVNFKVQNNMWKNAKTHIMIL